MTLQNIDFGSGAENDGEFISTAFAKIQANFEALFSSDGSITHPQEAVASAATCDIGASDSDSIRITGTTTITSLGTSANKIRYVVFAASLTLTHNATTLALIGGTDVVTQAGDTAVFVSDASGNWRMFGYYRAAALATGDLVGPIGATDEAITRFDGTTGKLVQNSTVTINNSGVMAGASIGLGSNTVTGTTAQFNTALSDGDFATLAGTEELDNKTLDASVAKGTWTASGTWTIPAVTLGGTVTSNGQSFSGTIANLGTVSTVDVDGGTVDGAVIGGSSAAAITGTTITANTGFVGNLTGNVTGNADTVTWANEAADTSCFIGFGTAASGSLPLKSNANMTFNASTGVATFGQTIAGSITGNAATVTVADASSDTTTFPMLATDATGSLSPRTDSGLTYNASTNALTTTTFVGALTGNADTVTWANEATDTSCFIGFATAASGSLAPKTNTNMTFNSNTGVATLASSVLTTTDINGGTIDGAVIGGASAAAATFTTATVGNTGLVVGASTPFSDSAGTLTLQNVDALDATTESTIEAAIDTLANLTSVQGHTVTLTGALVRSGAHSLTLTTTGTTTVTLPTSGTLATTTYVPTAITVANEATDTTCFPLFATAATGDLGPKTNTNLTFNSNTGVLTSASSVLTTTDINGGTVDGVTIGGASAGAGTFTNLTATGVVTITAGTSPTVDAAGEIAIDTDADGNFIDQGLIVYHDGTQKMFVIAVDAIPSSDNHALIYDAASDKFLFEAQTGGAGGGATTALDNLAGVAINTSLVSDTNNTDDLGTSSIAWRTAHIRTSIELGAASDTTLTRASAGVVAVEGKSLATVGVAAAMAIVFG